MVNLKEIAKKYGEKEDKVIKGIVDRVKKVNLKQKVKSKSVLKSKRMTTRIPDYKSPSILKDPNRFFKDTMEETKKSLFFE
jgi:hypothetical protein